MQRVDKLRIFEAVVKAENPQELGKAVADGIGALDLSDLATKEDVAENRQRLIETRSELKEEIGGLRQDLVETKSELKEEIDGLRQDLVETKSELKEAIDGLRQGLISTRSELKEEFNSLRHDLIETRSELKEDFVGIRSDLREESAQRKVEISKLDQRMSNGFKWLAGMQIVIFGTIVGLIISLQDGSILTFGP